jgi:hypothetical protein
MTPPNERFAVAAAILFVVVVFLAAIATGVVKFIAFWRIAFG